MSLPTSTAGDDSPSPTVLQVSRRAIHLLWWHACTVSPWVERTVATGYRGAIVVVPISDTNRGWCSHYFVVPKKGGGLCPILDRVLNRFLQTYRFKMLTLRQLLSAISPGDWFTTIDRRLLSHSNTPRHPVSEVRV